MSLSTPAPPLDIAEDFTWLREFAASAIRLHPRRPASSLPVHVSKMGGLFFWPRTVPWPVCRARDAHDLYDLSRPEKLEELKQFLGHAYELQHLGRSLREPQRNWMNRQLDEIHELERRSRHGHCQLYLPLLQLCRAEFPELPFPLDTDLFQLLWCPYVHFDGPPREAPGFLVFWRRQADIADPLLQDPGGSVEFTVSECRLAPEYVTEYPVTASFEAHFRAELDQWQPGGASVYDELLSAAPGVKLFGYPRWIADAATPFCECGRMMKILLTVDSSEWGSTANSVERWRPSGESVPPHGLAGHGFSFGDPGALFLFYCPICPGPRWQAVVQAG